MSITIASSLPTLPLPFSPLVVQTSKTFPGSGGGGSWKLDPDFIANRVELHAGSVAVSSCELLYRYGNIKQPWDSAFAAQVARDAIGTWVRVSMVGGQGLTTIFMGQIEGHSTELYGTAVAPSGVQRFSAVGGLRILEKLTIATAYSQDAFDTKPQPIGWIPPMNQKDRRGLLVGNKNDSGLALYGGSATWTHLDYVNYLIANVIQQKDKSGGAIGPTWTLTGQFDILANMATTIDFGQSPTVASALRKLIPVQYGIDFNVLPTDAGFEINVFALVAASTALQVAGVSVPTNPKALSFEKDTDIELVESQLVTTTERRVDKVIVRGRRIVVCGTLYGKRAALAKAAIDKTDPKTTLIPKWSSTLQSDYITAGGADTTMGTTAMDRIRKSEKYREVFQHLGAPQTWDLSNGDATGAWAVSCKADGSLTTSTFQKVMRETLSWIPLHRGFDYTRNPAFDNTLGDHTEEPTRPPQAWIYDENPEDGSGAHYVSCDESGIHTSKPYQDWGIMLNASPNHLLALNHLDPATQAILVDLDEETELRYDYETAVATVAIESDWPVSLTYTVPSNMAAGDGSTMDIVDEGAELWVLLPQTIVDVKNDYKAVAAAPTSSATTPPDFTQLLNSGNTLRVLRDDRPRLALLLAGAVGRYINERGRAHLAFKGFRSYFDLIGTILTTVQQGDALKSVGAPITSVIWALSPKPMTTVKTGYA